MGLIQNLLKKTSEDKLEFKRRYKDAEMELKIQNRLEERSKSSAQRELEANMKRLREDDIKKELDKVHEKQKKESWKSSFNVLKQDKSILKDDRPILKEKNLFLDNKAKNPLNQKRMFFKWKTN